jgi:hypothetical protein
MNEQKYHSILYRPDEYEITDFHYRMDKEDSKRSFIDMTLTKNADTVTLRFWQPINLKIEERFPEPTGGMVFYDLSADGLENIGIEVADKEATLGSVTFSAKSVEKIG